MTVPTPQPSPFFQFEADFIDSLRCIPMIVRYKLDICGIKLKLEQWHRLKEADRQHLVTLPCTTPEEIQVYREQLRTWVKQTAGLFPKDLPVETPFPWNIPDQVPEATQTKAQEFGFSLTVEQWTGLEPLQRFALVKLSRPSHENHNFLPALREFGLIN